MNILSIVGNLTADATYVEREIAGIKTPIVNFTVAANYGTGSTRSVQYVRVTLWRNMAKNTFPYLKKGLKVSVVGPATVSVYKSNQDGGLRGTLEIRSIKDFSFEGAAKRDAEQAPELDQQPVDVPEEDEGYPFD